MGLVIILVMGLYLLIAIGVVSWAMSYAKKNGKRVMRWGWGAAFVMFLIPFWDWIPTVAAHKYYCATEAGFWVYKTPEQWKRENPNMRILDYGERKSDDFLMERTSDGGNRTTYTMKSNIKYSNYINPILFVLKNRRVEESLLDEKQKKYLAKKVTFQSGRLSGPPKKLSHFKFWINLKQCEGENGNADKNTWDNSINEYRKLGE